MYVNNYSTVNANLQKSLKPQWNMQYYIFSYVHELEILSFQ